MHRVSGITAADSVRTVLLIEGSLASLDLMEAALARLPRFRVVPVMQGRLGLKLALAEQPALVLLDLELPDLPGESVLRHLHTDSRTASIPVITFGITASMRAAPHLTALGARAHFVQPLDIGCFLGLASALLADGKQSREAVD